MIKFLTSFLEKLTERLKKYERPANQKKERLEENLSILSVKKETKPNRQVEKQSHNSYKETAISDDAPSLEIKKTPEKVVQKKNKEIISYPENPLRDVIDLMEFPFLALSKDRVNPIIYESEDKTQKVEISGHRGHFIASIYDWDIILVVAGKIQEILNNSSDIPLKKIIIPRHELLKALHKQDGKKQQKDLEKSLSRLQLTGINTTVNNKDYRHRAGFGFIESWGYLERKNNREMKIIHITLSEWLYELCCAQGSLLKSDRFYFELKSGLKRFLYRTARKHAGNNRNGWEFTVKKLYEKSGSEQEFKKFKSDLKFAVKDDNIPEYSMKWIEKNEKSIVFFKKKSNIEKIEQIIDRS
jgi:plasmid replication initiation protein